MSRFNLIDEKWIPVRFPHGTHDELSIRETLLRAKDIESIEDPSPLVVAALHRVLLAVLYRALEGPTDIDQARELFKSGFPQNKITDYLEKWCDRFWLFDETYPFYQIPTFDPKKWRAWTALAVEFNADTAKVLFDHTSEEKAGCISLAAATRWLLAIQTFAVSTGKSEISHTGTAPSAGSIIAIPLGKNLQDTMIFCLVPQNKLIMEMDIPVWERDPDKITYLRSKSEIIDKKTGSTRERTIERGALGVVDLYTWRTRSVRLREHANSFLYELGFASGIGYLESVEYDPMLGYEIKEVTDKESKSKVRKKFPLAFSDREVWRDFDSLLPDQKQLGPRVIEHAISLTKKAPDRFPAGVMVVGQKYYPPRPNVAYWRKELFSLPEALSGNRDIRYEIQSILSESEHAAKELEKSGDLFAKLLLSHGERKVEKADISNFSKQLNLIANYWPYLEPRFHEILRSYTLDADPDDIRCQWLKYIREALRISWSQHCASVATNDAWTLRALIKSEGPVRRKLKELNDEIHKYEPQELTA